MRLSAQLYRVRLLAWQLGLREQRPARPVTRSMRRRIADVVEVLAKLRERGELDLQLAKVRS